MKTSIISAALAATFLLCACGKASTSISDQTEKTDYTENEKGKTPAECKDYIQNACIAAVEKINAGDIKSIETFFEKVFDIVYDTDLRTFDEFADQVEKSLYESEYSERTEKGITIYSRIEKAMISLAPFTGHFTLDGKTWKYKDADDFQIQLLVDGSICTLSLSKSKETFKFTAYRDSYEYTDTEYAHKDLRYISCDVELPKVIELNIKKGSQEYIKVKLNLSVSIKDGEIPVVNGEPAWDTIMGSTLQAAMSISAQGYEIAFTKFEFMRQNLAVNFVISKDKEQIIAINVAADNIDVANNNYEITPIVQSAALNIDVMSKFQIAGNVHITQLISDLENLDKYSYDENRFKNNLEIANNDFNFGVFFGNGQLQASCKLDAFRSGSNWYCEPILKFNDGSAITYTFEDYFTETSFSNLLAKIQHLIDNIE